MDLAGIELVLLLLAGRAQLELVGVEEGEGALLEVVVGDADGAHLDELLEVRVVEQVVLDQAVVLHVALVAGQDLHEVLQIAHTRHTFHSTCAISENFDVIAAYSVSLHMMKFFAFSTYPGL